MEIEPAAQARAKGPDGQIGSLGHGNGEGRPISRHGKRNRHCGMPLHAFGRRPAFIRGEMEDFMGF